MHLEYAERIEAERRRRNAALQLARQGLASAQGPWTPKTDWASSFRCWIEHNPWQSTGGGFGFGFLFALLIKTLWRGDSARRIHVTVQKASSKACTQESDLGSILEAALNIATAVRSLIPPAAHDKDRDNGKSHAPATNPGKATNKEESQAGTAAGPL